MVQDTRIIRMDSDYVEEHINLCIIQEILPGDEYFFGELSFVLECREREL